MPACTLPRLEPAGHHQLPETLMLTGNILQLCQHVSKIGCTTGIFFPSDFHDFTTKGIFPLFSPHDISKFRVLHETRQGV